MKERKKGSFFNETPRMSLIVAFSIRAIFHWSIISNRADRQTKI